MAQSDDKKAHQMDISVMTTEAQLIQRVDHKFCNWSILKTYSNKRNH